LLIEYYISRISEDGRSNLPVASVCFVSTEQLSAHDGAPYALFRVSISKAIKRGYGRCRERERELTTGRDGGSKQAPKT